MLMCWECPTAPATGTYVYLFSHKEWQQEPSTFLAASRTAEFLTATYEAVKKDTTNRLKPSERKGVSTEMH